MKNVCLFKRYYRLYKYVVQNEGLKKYDDLDRTDDDIVIDLTDPFGIEK